MKTYFYFEIETDEKIIKHFLKVPTTSTSKEDAKEMLFSNFGSNMTIIKLSKTTKKNYDNYQF
jgi:hypothetical protein